MNVAQAALLISKKYPEIVMLEPKHSDGKSHEFLAGSYNGWGNTVKVSDAGEVTIGDAWYDGRKDISLKERLDFYVAFLQEDERAAVIKAFEELGLID